MRSFIQHVEAAHYAMQVACLGSDNYAISEIRKMNFSLDLSKAIERAKGRTELVIRRTVLEAFSKVIYKSAVDTGRFKGAWAASQGSYSTTPPTTLDKAGSVTVGRMRAAVMAMPLNGSTIYLTNALPYSLILEYGRANGQPGSMQMPQGVVRITLAELTSHYGT